MKKRACIKSKKNKIKKDKTLQNRFWYAARVYYMLLAVAVLLFSMLQGGRIVGGLTAVTVLLLPVSAFYALLLRRQVLLSHMTELSVCSRAQPLQYRCVIRNNGILSASFTRIRIDANHPDLMTPAVWIVPCAPFEKQSWQATLTPLHRGTYTLSITEAAVSDPFRLFRFKPKTPETAEFLALPRLLDIPEEWRRRLDTVTAGRVQSFTSDSPAIEARKYHYGDSMRRIHWKLSARHGEIMVREYEQHNEPCFLCVLDTSPIEAKNPAACEDTLIENCLAILHYALMRQISVTLVYSAGTEAVHARCNSLQEFETLRRTLAALEFNSEAPVLRLFSDIEKNRSIMLFTAYPPMEDITFLLIENHTIDLFLLETGKTFPAMPTKNSDRFRITYLNPES